MRLWRWRFRRITADPMFVCWPLAGDLAVFTATREPNGVVRATVTDIFGSTRVVFDQAALAKEASDGDEC